MGSGHIELKLAGVDKGALGTVFTSLPLLVGVDQGPGHVHGDLLQLWGAVRLSLNFWSEFIRVRVRTCWGG